MSRITTIALLAVMGLAPTLRTEAQELQGAASALQQMAAPKVAPPKAPPKAQTPEEVLRSDLAAFRDKASSLPPQEAAHGWLALVDRYAATVKTPNTGNQGDGIEPLAFREVLEALPPPTVWNALTTEIQARQPVAAKRTIRDLSLMFLTHVLQDDPAAQWKDLDALQALLARANETQRAELAQTIIGLSDALTKQSGDPKRILQGIELHLAIQQGNPDGQNMQIPDLVTLLGPQKAEVLLRRVLVTSSSMIEIPVGDVTRRLAQKLALELAAKVKVPQWKLAESPDTTELYEALAKRFVKTANAGTTSNIARAVAREQGDNGEKTARTYYLLGLIVKGRTQKAAQVVVSFGTDQEAGALIQGALTALNRSGHTGAVADFLHAQLTQNPNLPLWDIYIEAAPRAGQIAPMLTLVRAAAARKDLSKERRDTLQAHLYRALLAADQVDEAVTLMRRILAASNAEGAAERLQTALQLVRLGYYLKQDAWIQEGVTFVKAALQSGDYSSTRYLLREYVPLLREMGRYAEAEKASIASLVHAVQDQSPQRGRFRERNIFGEGDATVLQGRDELIGLAQLYHQTGRYADVMTLLDKAPNWVAKDVSDLGATRTSGEHDFPMQYIAAVALAETGKRAEAAALLESLLSKNGGFDPGYERLLALKGPEILPFLDALFLRNRFEERPLIWKATVLQRAGRLEEAEKTIREAIAIDPSDGEEGHGDRMRAYSVLADIREARGDQAQAMLYREAVHSIRISEHADDLLGAGLVTRAIKLYEEALTHFADAYCIQSRLAIQMMESGNLKAAEEHYRRAYELMPDSFGRMESHCFGCEGVFRGDVAGNTAERVFQELLKKTPNKPQVHYLAGYLRDEQERYPEALVYYREAVTLDPDYVNAWGRLQALGEHIALPRSLRNTAALNRMRLQNDFQSLSEVTDLRAAWTAVQTARAANPPPTRVPLYPLAASRAAIDKLEAEDQVKPSGYRGSSLQWRMRNRGFDGDFSMEEMESRDIPLPGKVLAQHQIVALISAMLDTQFQRAEQ
ncbi:MAG: repeat-containing protein [Chthonomonadales bacterium]|nr:repeat-containing protein [Chthonomonadales bacterium]